jgi:alkanesulfonate monooxygenase SsuD/methylene tetrahydromethanopterin reductase-like flavin-dependent oxidoreductase (luciferase family)
MASVPVSASVESLDIGLGLPNADRSLRDGRLLVDVARRAEDLGFSTLGTLCKNAYPSFEELVVLAAAAGATRRIGLFTDILLAATREPVLLAKQAATLDQVSHGRFVLGVAAGGREDDFGVTGTDFRTRGKRLDAMLDVMHRAWRGDAIPGSTQRVTPEPVNRRFVPTAYGGQSEAAVRRVAKYGIGYTFGAGTPDQLAGMMRRVNAAWEEAGRDGKPRFWALGYFALGPDVAAEAEDNLLGYYGPELGPRVWARAMKTPEDVKARVKMFEEVGCDEYLFFMAAAHPDQAERLAQAVF